MVKPVFNNQQVINQIDSGSRWTTGGSTATSITYGITTNSNWFPASYGENAGWSALNAKQTATAHAAIEVWDDVIASSITASSNPNAADIRFSNSSTGVSYAHAYYPGVTSTDTYSWQQAQGSVWLNPAYSSLTDPDVGEYGFMTFIHEIGHTLGLNHPGNYNGGSPTYANNALYEQDTHQWTVMSYFNASNTGADWNGGGGWQYAETPMIHDILTIQAIYGADQTTRTGDTIYGFNTNAGNAIYDFSQNSAPVLTIYDAGGNDTLDLSGFSQRAIINLEPGTYSSAGGTTSSMTYNIGIANGTWIENAVGGSGDDTIYGNTINNVLQGGGGDDFLYGLAGNDTLQGGGGTDWAGFSFDFIDYAFSFYDNFIQVSGEGIDSVYDDTEWFQFADFNISYTDLTSYFGDVEVEANGDHKLIVNGNLYYIEDASANQVGVYRNGGPVGPDTYAGWSAIQAEDNGSGGFQMLLKHTMGNHVLWQLDSSGVWQSGAAVSTADLAGLETTFQADLNGDSVVGSNPTTLETNGNNDLIVSGNQYFIEDASANQVGVYRNGGPVGPDTYAGWSAIQAEDNGSGGFQMLLKHTMGNHVLWQLDSSGVWQSGAAVSTADLAGLETTFQADLNGDSVVGSNPTTLETNGNNDLIVSGNQYFIEDASANQVGVYRNGGPVGPDTYAGWSAIQAEDNGSGGFQMLLKHTMGNHVLWQLDSSGVWQSGAAVSTADLAGLETTFQADLNGDSVVGSNPTTLETNGNNDLIVSGNQYFIEDASANQVGVYRNGGPVGPDTYAGWSAIQAEDNGSGGFQMLLKHTMGNHVLWQLDSSGVWQSGAAVSTADLAGLETTFQADLNGDNAIGSSLPPQTVNDAGQNTLTGTDGSDTFALTNLDANLIMDYDFLEGDDIDLTALFTTDLNNSNGGSDDRQLADFVRAVENGSDTSLEVDTSGSGNNFTQVATLQGIATGDLVRITFNDDDGGASLGNIVV